jgi:hypothetical protein
MSRWIDAAVASMSIGVKDVGVRMWEAVEVRVTTGQARLDVTARQA